MSRKTKFVTLAAVGFAFLVALVGITVGSMYRMASQVRAANEAVDISYVVTRPLFLLAFAVIVGLTVWACRRWVFREEP